MGWSLLFLSGLLAATIPAQAQEYPLLEKFSFRLEGGFAGLDTTIRVDAKEFDFGTAINFESDLDLDSSKGIPLLALEYQLGKRHRLIATYQDIDRSATTQIATEIEFGDVTFPIDANLALSYDIQELLFGWNYYFLRRQRHVLGTSFGFRLLDLTAILTAPNLDLSEGADISGPLPFLGLDYRYAITPKWRLGSNVGYLDVEVGDIGGRQVIVGAGVEHLTFKNVGFGLRARYSDVDAEADGDNFIGAAGLEINNLAFFVRLRAGGYR